MDAVAVAVEDIVMKKVQAKTLDDDDDDNHKPLPNHRPGYVSMLEEPPQPAAAAHSHDVVHPNPRF